MAYARKEPGQARKVYPQGTNRGSGVLQANFPVRLWAFAGARRGGSAYACRYRVKPAGIGKAKASRMAV